MGCHLRAVGTIGVFVLVTAGCCPVPPGGPAAAGVTKSMSLTPGEIRYFDVDVPSSTTQLNFEFDIDVPEAPLRVREIESDCVPGPRDSCPSRRDWTLTPRPPGVRRFTSSGSTTPGARTRIVLENVSEARLAVTLTIVPWRAGCT
jgi:hypothetical protein